MFYGSTTFASSLYGSFLKKKDCNFEIKKDANYISKNENKIVNSAVNLITLSANKFSKKPSAFEPKEQCSQ